MENVTIRLNALKSQLEALRNIPRTFSFNVRKALAPALRYPLTVLQVANLRLNQEGPESLDTDKQHTSVILTAEEVETLTRISSATTLSRDAIVRLMIDYYLKYTRNGLDPANINIKSSPSP